MDKIIAWFKSETGRRYTAFGLVMLSQAAGAGIIPLDYAIPFTGMTTGQVLLMLGIGTAATSGSATRK